MMARAILCAGMLIGAMVCEGEPKRPEEQKPFRTPLEVLQSVNEKLFFEKQEDWTDVKIKAATEELKKVIGRQTLFTIKIKEVRKSRENKDMYVIVAQPLRAGRIPVVVFDMFAPTRLKELSDLKVGQLVTVQGTIQRASFDRDGKEVPLEIKSYECKLVAEPK